MLCTVYMQKFDLNFFNSKKEAMQIDQIFSTVNYVIVWKDYRFFYRFQFAMHFIEPVFLFS